MKELSSLTYYTHVYKRQNNRVTFQICNHPDSSEPLTARDGWMCNGDGTSCGMSSVKYRPALTSGQHLLKVVQLFHDWHCHFVFLHLFCQLRNVRMINVRLFEMLKSGFPRNSLILRLIFLQFYHCASRHRSELLKKLRLILIGKIKTWLVSAIYHFGGILRYQ